MIPLSWKNKNTTKYLQFTIKIISSFQFLFISFFIVLFWQHDVIVLLEAFLFNYSSMIAMSTINSVTSHACQNMPSSTHVNTISTICLEGQQLVWAISAWTCQCTDNQPSIGYMPQTLLYNKMQPHLIAHVCETTDYFIFLLL